MTCIILSLWLLIACSSARKAADDPQLPSTAPTAAVPRGSDIVEAKDASLTPATATPGNAALAKSSGENNDGAQITLKPDPQAKGGTAAANASASPDPRGGLAAHAPPPPSAQLNLHTPPITKAQVKALQAIEGTQLKVEAQAKSADEQPSGDGKKVFPPAQSTQTAQTPPVRQGVDPETALTWLKHGNRRFVKGWLRKDGQSQKDIERVAGGQKPHSVVLSCIDSRVPPELVFDQKLGEIVTVRSAGEALSAPTIASIEYAIAHLGTRLLVIMGHTNCGAVAAASAASAATAESENMKQLIADIQPRIRTTLEKGPSKNYEEEARANVRGIAADLAIRSPLIKEALSSGRVRIVQALYHLDNGSVAFE
ncbi:MAG: hypothetical protein C5B49_09355 [Bdellovibrio sp.]|nr:MAG: hypothetical protein C5B49_09355 [Bdellovibrio sp.]